MCVSIFSSFSQESDLITTYDRGTSWLSMVVRPDIGLPLGEDADLYGLSFGSNLSASWHPPFLPLGTLGFGATYAFLPTKAPGFSLSAAALSLQGGVQFPINRSLTARGLAELGYFGASENGGSGSSAFNPYISGGASLGLAFSKTLEAEVGASYRSWYGLWSGVSVNLGISLQLGSRSVNPKIPPDFAPIRYEGSGLGFVGVQLDSVFPVFYKYYDNHVFGRILVHNFENAAVTGVKATVNVKRYMDEAKPAGAPSRIAPGATATIELFGLFTDAMLDIAEITKLPISIVLEYTQFGQKFRDEYIGTLEVRDRNGIIWDDDRKAAAFISSKDPEALAWSKSVAATVRDYLNPAVNPNLQAAMAVHEALRTQNFAYVKDPTSALESQNRQIVDSIQFPRQTLGYKAGKCSDLTVLYCSFLESVGIATALLTTPGHILMAVDLEMDPKEVPRVFARPDDLIIRDGKVWLPLETTDRKGSFSAVWQAGAQEWRDAEAKKASGFYQVHDAWKKYQPVVYEAGGKSAPIPDARAVVAGFTKELNSYIGVELGPRVASIETEIVRKGASAQIRNKLGVLYARYGQWSKAEDQFSSALNLTKDYQPALFNMANLHYLRGKYAEAISLYNRVLRIAPSNTQAILSIARTNLLLGKYAEAISSYDQLKKLDPTLAAKFAYLETAQKEGTRAAEADTKKGYVLWQD
jgi:tetratricopeptide (TPR) repeat protein